MYSGNLRSCHDNNISVALMLKFGPSYKMLTLKEKHEKGLGFGLAVGKSHAPSPAGAMLLSRVFRAKSVSTFLGIKILF